MNRPPEQDGGPTCPRCGSDETVTNPESDLPGDTSRYGCDSCLYLWSW